uniref:Lipase domain-containing protein n=1 Tax=Tetranychus urticae TaxID=32264 RepID=T1KJC1_TETUR
MSAIDLGGLTQPLQGAFDVIMVFYMDATKHFQAQSSNLQYCLLNHQNSLSKSVYLAIYLNTLSKPLQTKLRCKLAKDVAAKHDTEAVGNARAEFIFKLCNFSALKSSNIDLIGHSLGAHIALKRKGLLIGRITGLDPAGPLFTLYFYINGDCSLWNLPKNIWRYGWVGGFTNTYACKNMFLCLRIQKILVKTVSLLAINAAFT